jgi:uncharacterized protein
MQIKKRITDPVHGSILLTDLEADVVASKSFQRLHNVRQLGLAYYVFPAANYSRLSHSLGACHNASKMISAIRRNGGRQAVEVVEKFQEALRLGALLHDLGHYPFSHATEHQVDNYYKGKMQASVLAPVGGADADPEAHTSLGHEALGGLILENDPELMRIFERHGKSLDEVVKIFNKADPANTLVEIISSDLDCDRLDYLRRTAHHTGLPYGSVDTDFLVSQATIDGGGRFSYTGKAARAADHLLVSRYYDYLQVPFHKTVAALEWSLVTCISELLSRGLIDCSIASVKSRIVDGTWRDFDDNLFFAQFRELLAQVHEGDVLCGHLRAILERKPAKVLYTWQELIATENLRHASERMENAKLAISDLEKARGISPNRLVVWPLDVRFAKYQAPSNADPSGSSISEAEDEGAVRILADDGEGSDLLCNRLDTLFSRLIGLQHRGFRVLYLPSPDETDAQVCELGAQVVAKFVG